MGWELLSVHWFFVFLFLFFWNWQFTNHYFKKSNFHWSVAKSNLSLRNSMKCSTPGFPVLHYLPGFSQTCVHWVGNAIQPSHPLSPSSLAHNLSQHQGLFHWVRSLHHVAKKSNTSLKIDENHIVPLVHILNFYCSPHNRPVIERQVAGAGIMALFRKSANRKYGGLYPQNHLIWVRTQSPCILKEEGAKSSQTPLNLRNQLSNRA